MDRMILFDNDHYILLSLFLFCYFRIFFSELIVLKYVSMSDECILCMIWLFQIMKIKKSYVPCSLTSKFLNNKNSSCLYAFSSTTCKDIFTDHILFDFSYKICLKITFHSLQEHYHFFCKSIELREHMTYTLVLNWMQWIDKLWNNILHTNKYLIRFVSHSVLYKLSIHCHIIVFCVSTCYDGWKVYFSCQIY